MTSLSVYVHLTGKMCSILSHTFETFLVCQSSLHKKEKDRDQYLTYCIYSWLHIIHDYCVDSPSQMWMPEEWCHSFSHSWLFARGKHHSLRNQSKSTDILAENVKDCRFFEWYHNTSGTEPLTERICPHIITMEKIYISRKEVYEIYQVGQNNRIAVSCIKNVQYVKHCL